MRERTYRRGSLRVINEFKRTGVPTPQLMALCRKDKGLLYECFPALAPAPLPSFLDVSKLSYIYYKQASVNQFNTSSLLWNKLDKLK